LITLIPLERTPLFGSAGALRDGRSHHAGINTSTAHRAEEEGIAVRLVYSLKNSFANFSVPRLERIRSTTS
jgi:hypothetical protein